MKEKTLEEAAEKYTKQFDYAEDSSPYIDFIEGAKWQIERMYSEEDMREAYMVGKHGGTTQTYYEFKEWFESYKKK